jgi:hypothetical protein
LDFELSWVAAGRDHLRPSTARAVRRHDGTGHSHTYERVLRDDNGDGKELPYYVTGLGGHSLGRFVDPPTEGSAAHYVADFGTMLTQTSDASITFDFYSCSCEGSCHWGWGQTLRV